MTDESTAAEQRALETQLSSAHSSMRYWRQEATDAEDRAADLRRVARSLDVEITPLRTLFTPLWTLHTVETWEGQSANLSRQRLEHHEERCTTAIRSIDALIDDLGAEAVRADAWAGTAQSNYTSARRNAANIEMEMGRFDDFYI